MHQSIQQVLRCYVSARQTDWENLLPMCEFALNSTHNATTGYAPAYVVYGRELVLPWSILCMLLLIIRCGV